MGSFSEFSQCASSDNTGSNISIQNLTASEELVSLDDTDDKYFLVPNKPSALYKTQSIDLLVEHTEALNGEPVWSIGANSAVENSIGLFNPTKNIFSLIASADPRTSDDNEGDALTYNGESATGIRKGTPVNFGTDEGFIAKNGGTPAHYLMPGINEHINYGNLPELSGAITHTTRIVFETSDITKGQWVILTNVDGTHRFGILIDSGGNTLINLYNGSTANCAFTTATYISNNVKVTLEVNFDGNGTTNSDRLKIKIDGVLISGTYTGTIPTSLPVTTTEDTTVGVNGSSTLSGKYYEVSMFSDNKSESFSKDQFFSSQNEWQGDLIGSDNGNGTLDLSAEFTAYDAQQVWLNLASGSATQEDWGSGRSGRQQRGDSAVDNDETFNRYDISSLSGETVGDVRVLVYAGDGTEIQNLTLYNQNKTDLEGVASAPKYDFAPSTAWDTNLGSSVGVDANESTELTLTGTTLKTIIQGILNGSTSQDQGFVLDGSETATYLDVFSVKLLIKLSSGVIILPPPYIFRTN